MQPRLNLAKTSPEAYAAMTRLSDFEPGGGIEPALVELLHIRASQINGCAFCVDMHTLDARAAGETEQRLHLLALWREAPFYTPRERAALAWCEALTDLSRNDIGDRLYDELRTFFSERELVDLSLSIVAINGWNRLAKSFRWVPGNYRPKGA